MSEEKASKKIVITIKSKKPVIKRRPVSAFQEFIGSDHYKVAINRYIKEHKLQTVEQKLYVCIDQRLADLLTLEPDQVLKITEIHRRAERKL